MDFAGFLELLRYATMPIALGLAVYALIALRPHRLGLLLGISVLLLISYVGVPLPRELGGTLQPWIKHAPVYIGMFGLAVFLNLFARPGTRPARIGTPKASTMLAVAAAPEVAGHMSHNALTGWLGLLSDQGLHHIVLMPLFTAVLISALIRSADAPATLRRSLKFFLLGGTALAVSHLMEFIVFGLGFVPALHGPSFDILEVGLAYMMLFWTFLGIRSGRAATAVVVY